MWLDNQALRDLWLLEVFFSASLVGFTFCLDAKSGRPPRNKKINRTADAEKSKTTRLTHTTVDFSA